MEKREKVIQKWIDARKERNEIIKCVFYITVPRCIDIYKDEIIKKVEMIFDNNNVIYNNVDTVSGVWNLNRDWIESGEMDCIVEYCGVYPVGWAIEDVVEFERMESNGEIMVLVSWIENDRYIPNH